MDLQQNIIDATKEIFETMVMLDVSPGSPLDEKVTSFKNSVSGMVGLAGVSKGMISIHTPDSVAMAITSSFLGMETTEINDDVKDAIGELANMLAGNIKMVLCGNGKDITLSIPSAVHGEEYTVNCLADSDWVTIPFSSPAGDFLVELQIAK